MTDEDHSAAFIGSHAFHFRQTFFLKLRVANSQHFVDQQDFGIEVRSYSEGEADVHSTRITFHRSVQKLVDLGEGDDLIEFFSNLGARHSENRAVEENVFTTRQLPMKTCADFQKRADASIDVSAAARRLGDSIQNFQQRAL